MHAQDGGTAEARRWEGGGRWEDGACWLNCTEGRRAQLGLRGVAAEWEHMLRALPKRVAPRKTGFEGEPCFCSTLCSWGGLTLLLVSVQAHAGQLLVTHSGGREAYANQHSKGSLRWLPVGVQALQGLSMLAAAQGAAAWHART